MTREPDTTAVEPYEKPLQPEVVVEPTFAELVAQDERDIEELLERLTPGVEVDAAEVENSAENTDLAEQCLAVEKKAVGFAVRGQKTFNQACNALRGLKERVVAVEELLGKRVALAHRLHKLTKLLMDFYLTGAGDEDRIGILAAEKQLKQKVADHYERCVRRWEEAQAALESKAGAVAAERGEAAEALVAPATLEKQPGVSFSKVWAGEVVDLPALLKEAVKKNSRIPAGLLVVDAKVLNQHARALKGELNWPGVKPVWRAMVRVESLAVQEKGQRAA